MEKIFKFLFLLFLFACNNADKSNDYSDNIQNEISTSKQEINDPCPPDWIATGKALKQTQINDTTEQILLNDSLWFEVVGVNKYNQYSNVSYLRMYRINGLLEEEGKAIYFDHPIADFIRHGEWKLYDCNGELLDVKMYDEGQLRDNN